MLGNYAWAVASYLATAAAGAGVAVVRLHLSLDTLTTWQAALWAGAPLTLAASAALAVRICGKQS